MLMRATPTTRPHAGAQSMGGSRRARCNHTARRQRRSLVLGVLLELLQRASMAAGATFASRTELRTACNAWCADAASAAIEYGPIGDWDVSQVDDLHQLFRGCSSFNENINGWDVSRVTSLSARDRARSALAWPRFTCPPPLPYLATLLALDDCAVHISFCIHIQPTSGKLECGAGDKPVGT